MTSLSDLSDAELEAIASGDQAGFARASAVRHGVRPELVLGVGQQESRFNQRAVSPKGARGVMQLMPDTAKELGADPDDPFQNIEGGVRYLGKQLNDFGGDERVALAAYNAGPNAVKKHGGVPPYPETQKYVKTILGDGQAAPDIRQASDAELMALAGEAPAPKAPPKAQAAPGRPPQRGAAPARADPTIAQDAWSGFTQPFKTLAGDFNDRREAFQQQAKSGTVRNPANFAQDFMRDVAGDAGLVGDVLGLFSAPAQAVVRPTARGIVKYGPTPYTNSKLSLQGGKPSIIPGHAAKGEEAQALVEGALNTALSAARPANVQPIRAPMPKPMGLDDLNKAQKAAWDIVDASTYKFPKADAGATATDIQKIVMDADPDLYPDAAKWAAKISRMAERDEMSLGKLNTLKSRMGEQLLTGKEASVGREMVARVESLIQSDPGSAAIVAPAREAYKRFKKVEEVTNRVDSAELRAASTYAGGNKANATRQNLRPLIDKKSPQQMRNLTRDETKALNRVVRGSPAANAARVTGKLLDPRGLLGATVQTVFGLPTGGASSLSVIPGMAASEASNALTMKSVDELLKLISTGGVKYKPPPPVSGIAKPFAPLSGPTRLLGAAEVAAPPLLALEGPRREKTGGKSAPKRPPQRKDRR